MKNKLKIKFGFNFLPIGLAVLAIAVECTRKSVTLNITPLIFSFGFMLALVPKHPKKTNGVPIRHYTPEQKKALEDVR